MTGISKKKIFFLNIYALKAIFNNCIVDKLNSYALKYFIVYLKKREKKRIVEYNFDYIKEYRYMEVTWYFEKHLQYTKYLRFFFLFPSEAKRKAGTKEESRIRDSK